METTKAVVVKNQLSLKELDILAVVLCEFLRRCPGVRLFPWFVKQPDGICVWWQAAAIYCSGSFHRSALISLFHLQALCSYKHPQSMGLWCFCLCVYSEKSSKYVNFGTKRTGMNNRRRSFLLEWVPEKHYTFLWCSIYDFIERKKE